MMFGAAVRISNVIIAHVFLQNPAETRTRCESRPPATAGNKGRPPLSRFAKKDILIHIHKN